MNVLEPLSRQELENIFDEKALNIFSFQLEKSIIGMPEMKSDQEYMALQVPKEYLEQWCVQAINAKAVGAGSFPVDILKDNWGADVKSMSCKVNKNGNLAKGVSGETSLAQKFKDTGTSLDSLFEEKKFEEVWLGWKDIVLEKNNKVIEDLKLENIYYFFFLRGAEEFYLCGTKLNLSCIENVTIGKTTSTSIYLENYISSELGNIKIYKSKKRLELRLNPLEWNNKGYMIKIPIPNYLPKIDLRETDLEDYKQSIISKF